LGDGLFVHEVTSHEDVVHVAVPEQELVSQYALDHEAAGLIQPSRGGVATQYAQAELACAALASLLDSGLNEMSSGPEASRGRGGIVGPCGGVELPENLLVPELSSSNRYHPDRMPQIRHIASSRSGGT